MEGFEYSVPGIAEACIVTGISPFGLSSWLLSTILLICLSAISLFSSDHPPFVNPAGSIIGACTVVWAPVNLVSLLISLKCCFGMVSKTSGDRGCNSITLPPWLNRLVTSLIWFAVCIDVGAPISEWGTLYPINKSPYSGSKG